MTQENKRKRKYFILDTNVLLHNPMSIHSFGDNYIVIPIRVLEELDKFKKDKTEIGKNARMSARLIDSYRKKGSLSEGVKTKSGGTLIVSFETVKLPESLSYDVSDDIILSCALYYKNKFSDHMVFFVSKDINARIKADALGLIAVDYEKEKTEYHKIYKGYDIIEVDSNFIEELYTFKKIKLEKNYYPNHFFLFVDRANKKHSVIAKYDHKTKEAKLLNKSYFAMGIRPLNVEQIFAFDLLLNNEVKLVNLIGVAGTGKTLIALAAGLDLVLNTGYYNRLLVARPIIPMGKDIGFLPGSKEQKLMSWMQPIFDNLEFLFSNFNKSEKPTKQIKKLMEQNILEVEALTYIRGRSIPEQFIIIDEAQNLTPLEVKTIISRAGKGTKIVLTGDPDQIDNPYLDQDSNGLSFVVDRLKDSDLVGSILLSKSERSELSSLAADRL